MRDPIVSMLNAIDRETGGVAVIWCPDFGLRDWLVEQVDGLASGDTGVVRASNVEDALASPDRLGLLREVCGSS